MTVRASLPRGADPAPFRRQVRMLPADPAGPTVGLAIDTPAGTMTLGVKPDLDRGLLAEDVRPRIDPARARSTLGRVVTDGGFACVLETTAGARWCATDLTHLLIDGRTAFEAPECQFFQPTSRSDRTGRARWRRWEDLLPPR